MARDAAALAAASRLAVIAVGKASPVMAAALAGAAGRPVDDGLVVGTHCDVELPASFAWLQASHPVPDERSVAGARAALDLARRQPPDGLLVVLVSGGASALMALPAGPLTLADKQAVTKRLLAAGADITRLNAVRKHLSAVKGGRLAAASGAPVLAWLLSDVVGDDPSVIGSGPTVPDASTFADALAALDGLGGRASYPPAAVAWLERGAAGRAPESPKPGDPALARVRTRVVASARQALERASAEAAARGYAVRVQDEPVVGEARQAARALVQRAKAAFAGAGEPMCLLSCGETTVRVTGGGRGGRNQEFALAAAPELAAWPGLSTLASVGTDGVDGPTDAAGAVADSTTLERAAALGLSVNASLADNDAWSFFNRLGDLIRTGPTDTNVGDVQVLLTAGMPATRSAA